LPSKELLDDLEKLDVQVFDCIGVESLPVVIEWLKVGYFI